MTIDKFGVGAIAFVADLWRSATDYFKKQLGDYSGLILFPLGAIFFVILFIVAIIDLIVQIFKWIADFISNLFNSTDDDNARNKINMLSCFELNLLSNDQILLLINAMLDGPTGDDDENAILKLLKCLPPERAVIIINTVGVDRLQSDFHGSEFDDLQILLANLGIIGFNAWDDDATRLFVSRATCEQLNVLTSESLHQLFLNLLNGDTGDEDENTINKIMGCIDCSKINEVLSMPGTTWADFDDNIQGSEWRGFRNILSSRCGIG